MRLRVHWLLLTVAVSAAAVAEPPPVTPAPAAAPKPHDSPPPEDSFIEFLGSDDVGDAGLWDYLRHAEPRAEDAPPPPQEARK